jgi:hypothetical protein
MTADQKTQIKIANKCYFNLLNAIKSWVDDDIDNHNNSDDYDDDGGNTCSVCLEPFLID